MKKHQLTVTVKASIGEGEEEHNFARNYQEFELILSSDMLAVQVDGIANIISGFLKTDMMGDLSDLLED